MEKGSAKAFAKINLLLDIVGKRTDGYHLLRSVMQSVSLFDRITIEKTAGTGRIAVECCTERVPIGEKNIAYKAASLFFENTKIKNTDIGIRIEKHIPMQAGLGGGSADAAAVLQLMNDMCDTSLSPAALAEIGIKAGADVPFCIYGGTCLAEGVGERITRLPPLPTCRILLVKPKAGAGTKEIFEAYDASAQAAHPATDNLISALRNADLVAVAASVGNALEPVTSGIVKEVGSIRESLIRNGALNARMTGSGTAVFGIFEKEETLLAAKRFFEGTDGLQVFSCTPVQV